MTNPNTLLHDILQHVIKINASGRFYAWYELSAHVQWLRVCIAKQSNYQDIVMDSRTVASDKPDGLQELKQELSDFRREYGI